MFFKFQTKKSKAAEAARLAHLDFIVRSNTQAALDDDWDDSETLPASVAEHFGCDWDCAC